MILRNVLCGTLLLAGIAAVNAVEYTPENVAATISLSFVLVNVKSLRFAQRPITVLLSALPHIPPIAYPFRKKS